MWTASDLGQEGMPRGAKPAKVHATVGDTTPQVVKAKGSQRPYIRYGKGTRGRHLTKTYVDLEVAAKKWG